MKTVVSKKLTQSIILGKEESSLESYIENDGYTILSDVVQSNNPYNIIDEIGKSGLKGRGGAAFPVGIKWKITSYAKSEKKFVVCNADEGEPGTFKDRWILENRPHLIIEAMAICGYAVGASKGYIYIRGEYQKAINIVSNAIKEARSTGYIGNNIGGSKFSFDMEIRRGAGSYVCGEETALLESIEGKRAHPRFKPPFPGVKGLWGYPTAINNVETFANIVPILKNGSAWFRKYGTDKTTGTKLFAVSGSVNNPSLIEANLGIKLYELLEEAGGVSGGSEFQCALVGGAAGGFLFESELNTSLCYESLKNIGKTLGSGAILILNKNDNLNELIINILEFFRNESCGKCAPCRIGYPKLIKMFESYLQSGNKKDEIINLADLMFKTSLCALGQSAKIPIFSYFNSI